MKRYLFDDILSDLNKKMVILTGPRQVGKTYLAKQIISEFENAVYLNYDSLNDKRIIREQTWRQDAGLLVFDEIHKMADWKNYIKGVYDTKKDFQKILITGSARMDFFTKSGDSLAGRYYHYRLNPVTVAESKKFGDNYSLLTKLNKFGGFPEPFLNSIQLDSSEAEKELLRWQNQYYYALIREDILDFSRVQEITAIKNLLEILRTKVGSPISFKNLALDLEKSPNTIKNYIRILENLHIIFLIRPFHKKISRSLLREPKFYFYDSSFVKSGEGIKLENTVAVTLLKYVQYLLDAKGEKIDLHYVKTKEKKEVDFVLVKDENPQTFVEVKLSDRKISDRLIYFKRKFPESEFIQLVHNLKNEEDVKGIQLRRAADWLANLI